MTLFNIITSLQAASGGNAKKAILEANKDKNVLRDYLKATYDPRLSFFITEKTYPNMLSHAEEPIDFNDLDILEIVYQLCYRNITGNEAKTWLKGLLFEMTLEEQQLVRWMLLKDIKAGISVSTINKVWENLIFTQKYQRCSLPSAVKLDSWNWKVGVYSQEKLDGMYAAVSSKQVGTRNGSVFPYDLLPEAFKQEMLRLIPDGVELNGELIVKRNGAILSRKEGNGMLNSLLQGTPLEDDYTLHYVVWDLQDEVTVYRSRLYVLEYSVKNCEYFSIVPYRIVYSLQEATEHFKELLAQGKEGTVLKNPNGLWKDGTSKDCVKFKIEVDIDLLCTGMAEGTGKYKGMLGALQLESSCGKVKVDCGTGFTDAQRKNLWENAYPVGRIVEIKANDLLDKVGSDTLSLFLPVFKSVRLDKDVADDLVRIECSFNSAKGLT